MKQALICMGAALVSMPVLAGDVVIFETSLGDHPDGNQSPPPYGIRLDNLFKQTNDSGTSFDGNGEGGVTTFSFSDGIGMTFQAIDTTGNGNADTLKIAGKVYGGEIDGSSYDYGTGYYALEFIFSDGVSEQGVLGNVGSGFEAASGGVNAGVVMNKGTFTKVMGDSLDGNVKEGTSWDIFQTIDPMAPNGDAFKLLMDGHRLPSNDDWSGRGWVTFNENGSKYGSTGDFLFIVVPLPSGGAMALAGFGFLAFRRRR